MWPISDLAINYKFIRQIYGRRHQAQNYSLADDHPFSHRPNRPMGIVRQAGINIYLATYRPVRISYLVLGFLTEEIN